MGDRPFDRREFAVEVDRLRLVRFKELPQVIDAGRVGRVNYVITKQIDATQPIWRPRANPALPKEPFERPKNWFEIAGCGVRIADIFLSLSLVNIFHGALTPECIRETEDGELVVVGAGMARLFGLDAPTVAEDPRYFAPCQRSGQPLPANPRADVWAVGAWMVGAATGVEPYARIGSVEDSRHRLTHSIPMEALEAAKVQKDVRDVISFCLSDWADARAATAWEDVRKGLAGALLVALSEAKARGKGVDEALEELESEIPLDTLEDVAAAPPALPSLAPSAEPPVPLAAAVNFEKETSRLSRGAEVESNGSGSPRVAPSSADLLSRRWRRLLVASPGLAAAAVLLLLLSRSSDRPRCAAPASLIALVPIELLERAPEVVAPLPVMPSPPPKVQPRPVNQIVPRPPDSVPKGCGDYYYCDKLEVVQ
jgi:hypothetical protein